jgi:hypothetical protein
MQPLALFRKISYPCGASSSGRWWVAKPTDPGNGDWDRTDGKNHGPFGIV